MKPCPTDDNTGRWAEWLHENMSKGAEHLAVYISAALTSSPTKADLSIALELAVGMLAPYEPGDSRAVSNEFVALACVVSGDACEKVMSCIKTGLANPPAYVEVPA